MNVREVIRLYGGRRRLPRRDTGPLARFIEEELTETAGLRRSAASSSAVGALRRISMVCAATMNRSGFDTASFCEQDADPVQALPGRAVRACGVDEYRSVY
jgi:hypothetical protein